jgi:L-cysteine:1D-myo-inositol 2-amino-2-deoxy-alpha-D-glucopyranoside ligase
VRQLIEAGVAYVAGGSVYFHVDAWPSYGKLSRIPRDQMLSIANERGNRPDDPHKRDPLDFVLWQAHAPGEPAWDSPWGPGRPGWHIECSTMVHQLLGETVDIHGGGTDLIFPHHESEIAQAECAGREPFARWWFHTAMVQHAGKKISKSLGNLVMLRDLLQTYSPDALRLYLAGHHYRQVWQHDPVELERAERLTRPLREAVTVPSPSPSYQRLDPTPSWVAFTEAMARDLDTPAALAILARLADGIVASTQAGRSVEDAQTTLRRMGHTFGLRLDAAAPEPRAMAGWNAHIEHAVR